MEKVAFLISAGLLVLANVVWFAYRYERIRNTLEEWWGTFGTAKKDEHMAGVASESGESVYRASIVACEHMWLLPSRPYIVDMSWHELREDRVLPPPKMSEREKFILVLLLLADSSLAAVLLICFVGLGPEVNCNIASVFGTATSLIGALVVILDIFFG